MIGDSISQCVDHGECYSAIRDERIEESVVLELGDVINHPEKGRTHKHQITIADLTGVAVQDIEVATMVATAYLNKPGK